MPIRSLRVEWDPAKAIANQRKHRVSFEEAETVFYDGVIRIISARNADASARRQYEDRWR